MVLSPEIERLLLIVVFLPNVVMAWKFGWQGGVLSGLLGSMMITIARQIGVGFSNLVELEIFLATQALLGIGLGIAISRQQHLALNLHHYRQRLEAELAARRALAEKLIHTEEDTRKSLARELARRNRSEHYRHSDPVATGDAGTRSGASSFRSQPNQRTRPPHSSLHPPVAAPVAAPRA